MKNLKATQAGYSALIDLFKIQALPNHINSFILDKGSSFTERYIDLNIEKKYFPKKKFTSDFSNPINHIEFALKHEGVNLEILKAAFKHLNPTLLENYVNSQPTSKAARKIWFLYEFLTDKTLDLKNAVGGSYTDLLDPKKYYTGEKIPSKRHYIFNNLLGNKHFCPMVRKSTTLLAFEEKKLSEVANNLIEQYDPLVISRAVNYLYFKETMSSFEIERERPGAARSHRFVEALRKADSIHSLNKEQLVALQNIIVDSRFAEGDYRDFQNYIGTETRLDIQKIILDYIPPKPENVSALMEGLLSSLDRMMNSNLPPAIIAAAIAFGFVYIHPFGDGNGRLHRFIIHSIFAKTHFAPKGAIFPISAVILKDMKRYDKLLETISKPLLNLIKNYEFDNRGELHVKDDTVDHYRYIDYTLFAEFLFECVEKTIHTDFKNELTYIVNFDKAKQALQDVVDMPDKNIHLFMQFVMQNHGSISLKKRESHFSMLTDDEISQMEQIVRENLDL